MHYSSMLHPEYPQQGAIAFGDSIETRSPAPISPSSRRLIDSIMELNPTASPEFLRTFAPDALESYLDHLHLARGPRDNRPWVRRAGEPAVAVYRPTG